MAYDPANPPAPPALENPITKDIIINEVLFGLPTEGFSTTCASLPESLYTRAIDSAYSWIETELGITVTPTNYLDERHDYDRDDYVAWAYLNLYHFPVIQTYMVRAELPSSSASGITFPIEWVKTYKASGQVQLVPNGGSISGFITSNAGSYLPLMFNAWSRIPQLFRLDYVAGFTKIPHDINDLVAKKAANEILAVVSDILFVPGTTSVSLSVDSVSQNISLSRSKLLFQARIDEYRLDINTRLPQLRNKYSGIRFTVG